MTAILKSIMERDMRIARRNPGDMLAGCAYFAVIIALVPLALGGLAASAIGHAMIWIALLIAALPQMERFFGKDADDGSLDDLILAPAPLYMVVLAKTAAGWLTISAPLVIMAPILAVMLGLGFAAIPVLLVSLIIGSFALMLIGGLMAALTIGARRGVILLAVLTLPLAMPVLIFGTSATMTAAAGGNPAPHLALLAAAMLVLLATTPPATAAALRQAAAG